MAMLGNNPDQWAILVSHITKKQSARVWISQHQIWQNIYCYSEAKCAVEKKKKKKVTQGK